MPGNDAPHETSAAAEVVVLIVAWQGRNHLPRCLESVQRCTPATALQCVVVVDNGSTDGSGDLVEDQFPWADLVRSNRNRGFTGGNNLGWEHVRSEYPNATHLVLLNQDTVVTPGWIDHVLRVFQDNLQAAAVQSLLCLMAAPDKVNTWGNRSHFLGFGFVEGFGSSIAAAPEEPKRIDFASGAAVAIRIDWLHKVGLFEERMFLNLEDTDLSWKLSQRGGEVWVAPKSVVLHDYDPTTLDKHYYYLERNRWLLLLTYYKAPTLLLLAPALAAMEIAQCLYSLLKGVARQRLRAYGWWLRPSSWRLALKRRRESQQTRTITDREFLGDFSAEVHLPGGDPLLLKRLANPCLTAYWRCVRWLIRW